MGVDVRHIYKIIVVIFLFSLIGIASSQEIQKIFALNIIVYRNDTILLKNFGIEEGKISTFSSRSVGYSIKIFSFDDKVIFEKPLTISFIASPISETGLDQIQLKERNIYLKLPFSQHAKKIQITHNNAVIFELNVKDYLCNRDSSCSDYEDEINCPEDCLKSSEKPIRPQSNTSIVLFVVSFILIIIIIIVVVSYKRSSNATKQETQTHG